MQTPIIGGRKEITKDYNVVYLHEDDDARAAKLEMWIAKQIGDTLVRHYPNREWNVQVDVAGRVVVIVCPSLSTSHGYHLNMDGDTIEGLQRRAIPAGGEILERFGIKRSRIFNPDDIENLERMANGDAWTPDAANTVDPIKRGN